MFRPRLRAPSALGSGSLSSSISSRLTQSAQSALAPLSQAPLQRAGARSARSYHHMPVSRHDERVGVPNLLSPEGYDLAWTQHMALMLNRLNQLVAGTDYESRDIKAVLQSTARIPQFAAVFNHASMAHNTDFFFKQLIPASSTASPNDIPHELRLAIEDNFGSVETLRREFAAIANGMFGPGFIWLVKANNLHQSGRGGDNLRLVTTYLAGSPYAGAHYRRQGVDMNTVGAEPPAAAETTEGGEAATEGSEGKEGKEVGLGAHDLAGEWFEKQAEAVRRVYVNPSELEPTDSATSAASHVNLRPPGGVEVIPLLCLSTWEHVWLRDYGLGADGYGGKAAFVDAWWNVIDWEAVAGLADVNRPKLMTN